MLDSAKQGVVWVVCIPSAVLWNGGAGKGHVSLGVHVHYELTLVCWNLT